jgi:hypothetical protein
MKNITLAKLIQLIAKNVINRVVKKKNFIPEGALKKTFFPTHPPDHSNEFILI